MTSVNLNLALGKLPFRNSGSQFKHEVANRLESFGAGHSPKPTALNVDSKIKRPNSCMTSELVSYYHDVFLTLVFVTVKVSGTCTLVPKWVNHQTILLHRGRVITMTELSLSQPFSVFLCMWKGCREQFYQMYGMQWMGTQAMLRCEGLSG